MRTEWREKPYNHRWNFTAAAVVVVIAIVVIVIVIVVIVIAIVVVIVVDFAIALDIQANRIVFLVAVISIPDRHCYHGNSFFQLL